MQGTKRGLPHQKVCAVLSATRPLSSPESHGGVDGCDVLGDKLGDVLGDKLGDIDAAEDCFQEPVFATVTASN